jgi:hypothetical protein
MRLATWLCVLGLLPLLPAQNSTKKVRPAPGDLAARAGDAVPWRKDLAAALAEAKQSGKPVFWYVPAVQPSPMDRKPEIDRYLRGGPFSWPSTIDLLTAHFVPVAEPAKGDAAKQRGLVRNQFLEPGYLVLDGDGNTLLRVDQLTTLHPEWFEAPLRRLAKAPADGFPCHPALREAWAAYRDGDRPAAQARAEAVLAAEPAPAEDAEAHWLVGAALLRSGAGRTSARRCRTKRWRGRRRWRSKAMVRSFAASRTTCRCRRTRSPPTRSTARGCPASTTRRSFGAAASPSSSPWTAATACCATASTTSAARTACPTCTRR